MLLHTIKRALASLAILALLLISAELILRIYVHLRFGVPGKTYGIYMPDKELGAVHRPNSYNTNSVINNWGMRSLYDIPKEKPKDVHLRIYCSGGSTTFCYNLKTEEAWPSLLQDDLRKLPGHGKDEVLNAGEICFTVSHEYALAKRLIPQLKPDIVILYGTGINEVLAYQVMARKKEFDFDRLLAQSRWGLFPHDLDQTGFLKRNSTLAKFCDYSIKQNLELLHKHLFAKKEYVYKASDIHPWVVYNFEETLRHYIRFLKDSGCRVIFVNYSDNGTTDNSYVTVFVRFFRQRGLSIAKEEKAPICDFAEIVENNPRRKDLYIASGVHLTREGSQLLASTLTDTILSGNY